MKDHPDRIHIMKDGMRLTQDPWENAADQERAAEFLEKLDEHHADDRRWEPDSRQVRIRLPRAHWVALDLYARSAGLTTGQLIAFAASRYRELTTAQVVEVDSDELAAAKVEAA